MRMEYGTTEMYGNTYTRQSNYWVQCRSPWVIEEVRLYSEVSPWIQIFLLILT